MSTKIFKFSNLLIAIVFIYAGFYKLSDVDTFNSQLQESPLIPNNITFLLTYAIPLFHILVGVLLLFLKPYFITLWISLSLLVLYTIYLLALFNLYSPPPCSCGGILNNIEYEGQITFNIACLIINFIAIMTKSD